MFTFLQLAHAGDAHAMNATVLMGSGGVGLCSCSFNLHTRRLTEAMSSPASASCANRTDQKGRKKRKKRRLWTTDANRVRITVNLKKMRHLRRAFQRFCASSHASYKCYMLENLAFFHNSSKTPDDADIANRKHYSAPAGALTKFLAGCAPPFFTLCAK